jgi:excinuclease UvrABC ATPase subunit
MKRIKRNRNKMDKSDGFTRFLVLFDNDNHSQCVEYFYLESPNMPDKFYPLTVYDRITLNEENMDRLKEDIVKMLNEHNKFGLYHAGSDETIDDSVSMSVGKDVRDSKATISWFTDKVFCPKCNITYPEFTTQHFSANRSE